MIRMVKLDDGNYVPEVCCSFTNPLTSDGKSEIDDVELPCGDTCEKDCNTCIIQSVMNEYGKEHQPDSATPNRKYDSLVGKTIEVKRTGEKMIINSVTEFQEDTFGQGNYAVTTNTGDYLYECEITILTKTE